MKLTIFNCPECGAPFDLIDDTTFMYCKYCGAKIMMDDIEFYKENAKTQRERIRTDAEVRKEELKYNYELETLRKAHEESKSDNKMMFMMGAVAVFLYVFVAVLGVLGYLD